MRTHVLDTITRHAAHQVTRRHSLLTLGGAALTATAATQLERASAKKKGKDCKKKERQRCTNDTEACRLTILLNCGDPGGCGEIARCCDQCTSTGFTTCVLDVGAA